MTNFQEILKVLNNNKIEYILIGGLAAIVHGCTSATSDLDIVYKRTPENIKKIVSALQSYHPRLRGAPDNIPFIFDKKTFENTLNFTLMTDLGALDLLAEIPKFESFDKLLNHSQTFILFDMDVVVINLDALIKNKKATGRTKDLRLLPELEEIKLLKKD